MHCLEEISWSSKIKLNETELKLLEIVRIKLNDNMAKSLITMTQF